MLGTSGTSGTSGTLGTLGTSETYCKCFIGAGFIVRIRCVLRKQFFAYIYTWGTGPLLAFEKTREVDGLNRYIDKI